MKTLKNIIAILAIAIMSLTFNACGDKTPADKFVDALNNAESKIRKASSIEDIMNMSEALKISENIASENQEYELTDADKEAIKKAMEKLYRTAYSKENELTGQNLPIEQIDMIVNMMAFSVDNATTFGDFVRVPEQNAIGFDQSFDNDDTSISTE